jgi:hypothetical protein
MQRTQALVRSPSGTIGFVTLVVVAVVSVVGFFFLGRWIIR